MCPRKSDSSQSSANNRLTNSFIREGATKVRRFPRKKVRGVEYMAQANRSSFGETFTLESRLGRSTDWHI